jgi:hypothetical protein
MRRFTLLSSTFFLLFSICCFSQIQINEGFVPGNRTMSASLEKNILFNATTRYAVTQSGLQGFDSNELAKLFDGSMEVFYTWGKPVTSANPLIIEIDNLPNIHVQAGGWIGFSTRYWPAKKFKIEGYDSWSANNWVTVSDVDNNSTEQYIVKAPYGAFTKLRFTFYEGCQTSYEPIGQMGLSEIYFIHPEAAQAYDGLLLKCNPSGNVGIGTTTIASSILQIAKNDATTNQNLTNSAALDIWNPNGNADTGGQINFRSDINTGSAGIGAVIGYLNKSSNENGSSGNLVFGVKKTNTDVSVIQAMTIQQEGNVGIGTTTPSSILQIAKGDATTNQNLTNGAALDIWNPNGNADTGGQINFRSDINTGPAGVGAVIGYLNKSSNENGSSGSLVFGVKKTNTDASVIQAMTIQQGGNVGIGTTTPDEALTVKGKIHTNEVIIDVKAPIADYVFHPTYKLMPLPEVEQYVKTNSHLPEIPSASEVAKNGMSMGEMQNKLLQKVEELTLYVIDLKKTVDSQQAKIKELEQK